MNPTSISSVENTLRYYDHHADRLLLESHRSRDLAALKGFFELLPQGARVLDAGCGTGQDLVWLKENGCQVEGVDASARMVEIASLQGVPVEKRDLRFLNLAKETYDGIWCNQTLAHLSIEECQRVLAIFFQGLKPRTGIACLSYLEGQGSELDPSPESTTELLSPRRTLHSFNENGFLSLVRQSGFQPLRKGERLAQGRRWTVLICRRV